MSINLNDQQLRYRRTKIIATVGPATSSEEKISQLILAGANVFRLNMSHGTHDMHRLMSQRIRTVAAQHQSHIAILADLCGPKIRVGQFQAGFIQLETADLITVTTRPVMGEDKLIPSQYAQLHQELRPQHRIFLDDGLLELCVESIQGQDLLCRVIQGGKLSNGKGMNLPDSYITAPPLTQKDKDDVCFALSIGIDMLALSFVSCAQDIVQLKELLAEHGENVPIIAKVERLEALKNSEEIAQEADAIMIARGDLGVELDIEQVPVVQKELISLAKKYAKPVIVATQMLESMTQHPRPTRAEVADVSQSVSSGVDAIMLSAETASGKHPISAVQMMNRIARQAESHAWLHGAFSILERRIDNQSANNPVSAAVARSTAALSRELSVHAIIVISNTGVTTTTMSSARPAAPIVAISPHMKTCCRTNLCWGVIPFFEQNTEQQDPLQLARRIAIELKLAKKGDYIIIVQGFNKKKDLSTPSITTIVV
ncbi:MAG: pyruvate kinase [Mariprofundaceae bacterium]|nr:pyruvate kinase [Mariprofundaceae bacterium]